METCNLQQQENTWVMDFRKNCCSTFRVNKLKLMMSFNPDKFVPACRALKVTYEGKILGGV